MSRYGTELEELSKTRANFNQVTRKLGRDWEWIRSEYSTSFTILTGGISWRTGMYTFTSSFRMFRQFGCSVRRFNVCKGDLAQTRQVCQTLLEQVFVPALRKPAEGFEEMSRSLLEGMWAMVPFLDYDAFTEFTRRLAGVETPGSSNRPLEFYSKLLLSYQIFVHKVLLRNWLLAWIVRPILNFGMWFSVYMTQRLPLLAYLQFGRSHVY